MTDDIIIRQRYLDLILPWSGKQLIKVLTGQRRVGKSYILRQLMQRQREIDPSQNIIYINKEDLAFESVRSANDLNDYVIKNTVNGVKNTLYIDEIQEIEFFEKALRSLSLDPAYDIYCTGSNAYMLSEVSTLLSGRYIEFPVYSLSYTEFLTFHKLQNSADSLMLYIRFGGLPYLKHLNLEDEIVYNYLKGVYSTILYRDVMMRHEVRNPAFLENLVIFLADNIGQLYSARKIGNYLKSQNINMATSQVIQYVQHLANAFLIHKTARYDIAGKRLFEIGDKYYFEDIGLRNALIGFKISDISKIIENIVYKHLLFNGYRVNVGNINQYEVDFVCRRKGDTIYIQVCYLLSEQSTVDREFGNLERIKDNYPKMVVSMDDFSGNTRGGIAHYTLKHFLSMEL